MKNVLKRYSAILMALVMCVGVIFAINVPVRAAGGSYVKVTEAPADWSGDYLIVYEAGNVAFDGSRTTMDAVSNTQPVTITNNEIEATDAMKAIQFTITKSGSNYIIQSKSGYYIGQTSNANGLLSNKTTQYNNTISLNSSDKSVNLISGGAYLRYNAAANQLRFRYYRSSSYTGQKAIHLYKYVEEGAVECEHVNTTTTTEPAGKTTEGKITVTCDDCGATVSTTPIPALRCTVTYNVPEGSIAGEEKVLEVTLPEPDALPEEYAGKYEFAGWAEEKVDLTNDAPALRQAGDEVTLEDDTTFYAVYQYSEKSDIEVPVSNSYVEKDIGDIAATDEVIVTMTDSEGTVYALANNNGASTAPTAIVVTLTNNEITAADDTIKWNVGVDPNGYVFYPNGVTDKWLYCTSANNGVRVGTNDNKVFAIDATSGYLTNNATSRYLGIYLTNPDWRCYTSVNTNIQDQTLAFYAKSASDGTVRYYTSTPTKVVQGASVDVGSDLTMNFYVDDTRLTNPTMTFAIGSEAEGEHVEYNDGGFFAFEGVPPHCMAETITAKLYEDGELAATIEYSVKENIQDLLNGGALTADQKQFVSNMLHYGDAAQNYKGNNDVLATEGVDKLLAATTELPAKSDVAISGTVTDVAYFKSANVWFDNVNKLIVKFNELPENAKLLVNGTEVSFDGVSYMTDGILASDFDKIYNFTIANEQGEELQTLTYSVNSYVYAKKGSATMQELVTALYNYGLYAEKLV